MKISEESPSKEERDAFRKWLFLLGDPALVAVLRWVGEHPALPELHLNEFSMKFIADMPSVWEHSQHMSWKRRKTSRELITKFFEIMTRRAEVRGELERLKAEVEARFRERPFQRVRVRVEDDGGGHEPL